MKKKVFTVVSVVLLLSFCGCTEVPLKTAAPTAVTQAYTEEQTLKPSVLYSDSLKGVWITLSEISGLISGKTAEEYTAAVNSMIKSVSDFGLNTVFLQVRAFSDAVYKSEYFPYSNLLMDSSGNPPEYDALSIFIESAHAAGISVQAWINPYRVGSEKDPLNLPENHPARRFYEDNKNTDALMLNEKGIYYNPASEKARLLILNGIRELIDNYKIDGIHFDDYFYPSAKPMGDEKSFEVYTKSGGSKPLPEWRRAQVSAFVSEVYRTVKSGDSSLLFGVSPAGGIEENINNLYADVEEWCREDSYIDYILPQLYYGFENENKPFSKTLAAWEKLTAESEVILYVGLAAYKSGKEDAYAGSGKNEWMDNSDIISRQYSVVKNSNVAKGAVFFSYSYLFSEKLQNNSNLELTKLYNVIK